ncbi:MAG: branched-chain amino acid transaminase [Myxococcales bacterium]|nr:branched-chain amino acid transaminase [Myxococcales bacterium]
MAIAVIPGNSPDVRVWLNGSIVDAQAARLPHLTHSFHYGLAAFEGIRAYETASGQGAVFRLHDHCKRLVNSAHIATLDAGLQFTAQDIADGCVQALQANKLAAGYLRPVIYIADGAMGIGAAANPIHVLIAAWKWGAYLGEEGLRNGIAAKISAFQRPGHATVMSKAKITGHYVNSILAKREALACGADEAILLNEQGYVTEASGENIFMVQDGVLITPPLGLNILGGITRATILKMARDLGVPTEERLFARDELYCADEVFLTGTAAEVTPVREVDGRKIGAGGRGPLTTQLQRAYFEVVQGRNADYARWLTPFSV